MRRKQGQKCPDGYIETQILIKILDNPEGIEEPEIRDFVAKNYEIGEKKSISNHLKKLKEKKRIDKITPEPRPGKENAGKPNKWVADKNFQLKEFWGEITIEDKLKIFDSEFADRYLANYFDEHYQTIERISNYPDINKNASIYKKDTYKLLKNAIRKSPGSFLHFMDGESKLSHLLDIIERKISSAEPQFIDEKSIRYIETLLTLEFDIIINDFLFDIIASHFLEDPEMKNRLLEFMKDNTYFDGLIQNNKRLIIKELVS